MGHGSLTETVLAGIPSDSESPYCRFPSGVILMQKIRQREISGSLPAKLARVQTLFRQIEWTSKSFFPRCAALSLGVQI
jgi:hypothetical protein